MRNRLFIALSLLIAGAAHAHPVGTIFSGPTDGDSMALYWNPAALSLSPESRVDVVANFAIPQATYTRSGTDSQTGMPFKKVSLTGLRPEPALGLTIDKLWKKRLRLGALVSVPLAGGAGWPEKIKVDGNTILGPTRYHATDGQNFSFYIQLGASLQLHRVISIGAAVNLVTSYVILHKHIDLLNQPVLTNTLPCGANPFGCENPDFSTPTKFEGTGFSAGGAFGILLTPIERLRIGLAYHTPVETKMSATINVDTTKLENFARQYFPQLQPLNANGTGHFTLIIPQRVHTTIAFDVIKQKLELSAGFRWVNTAATQIYNGVITQKGSTLIPDSILLAAITRDEYDVTARIAWRINEKWLLGFLFEYSPHTYPDAYANPSGVDFDTFGLNLGARFRPKKWFSVGATFTQYIVVDRNVKASAYQDDHAPPFNEADASGKYTGNSERVGVDFGFYY